VAVFHDLQKGDPVLAVQWLQPKIVQYDHVLALYLGEFSQIGAVGFSYFEFGEELRGVEVVHPVSLDARLISQCGSQIAFTHTGASRDEDVLVLFHKFAASQTQNGGAVKVARTLEVDGLDAGLVVEFCVLDAPFDTPAVALVPFRIHEHGDELVDGVMIGLSAFDGGPEGAVHAVELHLPQFCEGGFVHNC